MMLDFTDKYGVYLCMLVNFFERKRYDSNGCRKKKFWLWNFYAFYNASPDNYRLFIRLPNLHRWGFWGGSGKTAKKFDVYSYGKV